jgi:predicted enzyme related to lactoylglutathione lyase
MSNSEDTIDVAAPIARLYPHGSLSYVQIPALDVYESARFYERVFDWKIKDGGVEHVSFEDAAGGMIGAWVMGRTVAKDAGILPFIYVHGIDAIVDRINAFGGEIVRRPYPEGDLWAATFRDPAGNEIGIWQQSPR